MEILAVIADGQEAKAGILAYGPEGRIAAPGRTWGITKEFNMRRGVLIAFTAALAIWLMGCQQAPPVAAKPDLKAEEAKIMEADAAWLKAYQARDAAGAASFFAEDGTSYPSGRPKATGREAIQKSIEQFLQSAVTPSWTTTKLVVSQAADIAYSVGTYEDTLKDAKGKPVKEIGKFVTVWKKQPDGSWKVQEDSPSPDGPVKPVK
jgi:uncharacterized protein (TIGR02246 family)